MRKCTIVTLRRAPWTAKLGAAVILAYVAVAIFAPLIAPYGERSVVGPAFAEWSSKHILGTDNLGRDMLTRLIYGARNTLGIALATTVLAFSFGGGLGLFAGTVGGWFEQVL